MPRAWNGRLRDGSARSTNPRTLHLSAVSHDLRTPLAAILGLALTMAREDLDLSADRARNFASRIAVNARRLDHLVSDLLDLDRLSRGILELDVTPTDLAVLIRKATADPDLLVDHPVSLELEPVSIAVDAAKVERIVENLPANSVRHTPAGTRVRVKVLPVSGGAEIAVEDAGPGVDERIRQAIFEPFRQGGPFAGSGCRPVSGSQVRWAARRPSVGRGPRGRRGLVPRLPAGGGGS